MSTGWELVFLGVEPRGVDAQHFLFPWVFPFRAARLPEIFAWRRNQVRYNCAETFRSVRRYAFQRFETLNICNPRKPPGGLVRARAGSSMLPGNKYKTGSKAPRFIVIEGPLRVGKTTLAKILAEKLHARRVYDCEDNPFLSDFYKEKPGSALRAQMYFLMERQKRIREALTAAAPAPVLSDFLLEKDRIFANLNLDDEELKLYDRYYETLTAGIPAPDLVIYLQAKPEVLRARIEKKASRDRARISPEYIRRGGASV